MTCEFLQGKKIITRGIIILQGFFMQQQSLLFKDIRDDFELIFSNI
jgi:hypothetical protein